MLLVGFEFDTNNEKCIRKMMESTVKVLYLTNNQQSIDLYNWLKEREEVVLYSEPLSVEFVKQIKPQWILSYNYVHFIKEDVIDYMEGNIINMHISMLPWNRGASPNIWSFIENTPKGVTIHQIDKGLDTGAILYQQECEFDISQESFASSYQKLNDAITCLFKNKWNDIKSGNYRLMNQIGKGSYHSKKDLEQLQQRIAFEWDDNIAEFLKRYEVLKID